MSPPAGVNDDPSGRYVHCSELRILSENAAW